MRGEAAADGLDVLHALGRLEDGVEQDRLLHAVLRLKLGEELVEIVDVPRPSTLGSIITSSRSPTPATISVHVVQHPRRVEAVDARPQATWAEIGGVGHLDEAGAPPPWRRREWRPRDCRA
jgi:hypothetical protein